MSNPRAKVVNELVCLLLEDDGRRERIGRQKGRRPVSRWGLPWVMDHCGKRTGHWPTPEELLAAAAAQRQHPAAFVERVWGWLTEVADHERRRWILLGADTPSGRAERWRTLIRLGIAEDYEDRLARRCPARDRWRREENLVDIARTRAMLGDVGPHDVRAAQLVSFHLRGMNLVEVIEARDDGSLLVEAETDTPFEHERRAVRAVLTADAIRDVEPAHPRGAPRQRFALPAVRIAEPEVIQGEEDATPESPKVARIYR